MWIRCDKQEDGAFIIFVSHFLCSWDKIAVNHEFFGGLWREAFAQKLNPSYDLSFR